MGPGIYLTKIPEEALGYAEDRKTIIKVPVLGLNSYKLDRAFSVTSNNKIIELYVNKYKGNWLIMVTGTDKITCGLIGGQQEFIFE